jgi:anti-sigma regulatory factor (Ser/Thr protein kinase)
MQDALTIREESEIGNARRRAQQAASNAGLSEETIGQAAIIASEAATNVIRHGHGGEILLRELKHGLEILAVDKGPGIQDVAQSLSDGFSTVGTAGNGLGAIQRLSTMFDIYSQPQSGTAIVSRLESGESKTRTAVEFGVVCRPKQGELVSGDSWGEKDDESGKWFVVADGLGHGPQANEAALEAVKTFLGLSGARSTTDYVEAMHGALRKTRGAAVAVVQIDLANRQAKLTGVGNIGASVVGGGASRSLVSHNGILGHEVRRIQEFSYPWLPESRLIISSDGLATWNVDRYPGLLNRHPSIVAGVLYRDFWRQRDDVSVLVAQEAA